MKQLLLFLLLTNTYVFAQNLKDTISIPEVIVGIVLSDNTPIYSSNVFENRNIIEKLNKNSELSIFDISKEKDKTIYTAFYNKIDNSIYIDSANVLVSNNDFEKLKHPKYTYDIREEFANQINNTKKNVCDKVYKTTDKYTKEIHFGISDTYNNKVNIYKYQISHNKYKYYLTLRTGGSYPDYGTGVYILLKNGKTIIKDDVSNDIDVNNKKKYVFENSYNVTTTISLTSNDVLLLSNSELESFKIHIYEEYLSDSEADIFLKQIKCLINSK